MRRSSASSDLLPAQPGRRARVVGASARGCAAYASSARARPIGRIVGVRQLRLREGGAHRFAAPSRPRARSAATRHRGTSRARRPACATARRRARAAATPPPRRHPRDATAATDRAGSASSIASTLCQRFAGSCARARKTTRCTCRGTSVRRGGGCGRGGSSRSVTVSVFASPRASACRALASIEWAARPKSPS